MGRKLLYMTEEARQAAKVQYRKTHNAKVKNISVDADLVERLNKTADRLSAVFGFRPTLSQTLRYLIKTAPLPRPPDEEP